MKKKKNKTVGPIERIELLPRKSKSFNFKTLLAITKTDWQHANKCLYSENWKSFFSFGSRLSLYLTPIVDRFTFITTCNFSSDAKVLVTSYKNYLRVEVNMLYKDTIPAKIVFKFNDNMVMLYKCITQITRNDDTLIKAMVKSILPEEGILDVSVDEYSCNIGISVLENFIPIFIDMFLTVSYLDYLKQHGRKWSRRENNMIYLSSEDLAYISSEFNKYPSNLPNLVVEDINHATEAMGLDFLIDTVLIPKKGKQIRSVLTRLVGGNTSSYVQLLEEQVGRQVDLDKVDESVDTYYVALDKDGVILDGKGVQVTEDTEYLIGYTGYKGKNKRQLYFLLGKKSSGMFIICLGAMGEIIANLLGVIGSSFKNLPTINILKTEKFTNDNYYNAEFNDINLYNYYCSEYILDNLGVGNVYTDISEINMLLFATLRKAKRMHFEQGLFEDGNVVLPVIDTKGDWVEIHVDDWSIKVSDMEPRVLSEKIILNEPLLLAEERYMRMNPNTQLLYEPNNIMHILKDRSYRISDKFNDMSSADVIRSIDLSIDLTMKMLKCNPYFAVPCYSAKNDKVNYLIPFIVDNQCRAALLVVRGVIKSIYSLEMARRYGSIFNRPMPCWLNVD